MEKMLPNTFNYPDKLAEDLKEKLRESEEKPK